LSYQGQFALNPQPEDIPKWKFYGLYYRVNTNHVTAFSGPELSDREWTPLFAHYMNLLLCDLILEFVEWYEIRTGDTVSLGEATCKRITTSLHLPASTTHKQIRESLIDARIDFEA